MKLTAKNQSGAAHLAALALLVIVAAVGFVGYRVWQNQEGVNTSNARTAISTKAFSVAIPTAVKNVSDLNQAATANSSMPLDSDLSPSQFDSDVSQLQ